MRQAIANLTGIALYALATKLLNIAVNLITDETILLDIYEQFKKISQTYPK